MSISRTMEAKSPAQLTLDCLTISKGDRRVPIFFLENTTITIGRDYYNSISINSCHVSRNHAVLQKLENQWQVKDCQSTRGVFINNDRISEQGFYKLIRGDAISLGHPQNSLFKFVLTSYDALSLPEIYFKVPCKINANGLVIDIQSGSEDEAQLDLLKEYKEQFQTHVIEKIHKIRGQLMEDDGDTLIPNSPTMDSAKELKQKLDAAMTQNKKLASEKEELIKQVKFMREKLKVDGRCQDDGDTLIPNSPTMDSAKELKQKLDKAMTQIKKLASDKEELIKQVKFTREKLKVEVGNGVTLMHKVENLESELSHLEDAKEEIRLSLLKKNNRLRKEKMEAELREKYNVDKALRAQLAMQEEIEVLQKKLDAKDSQVVMRTPHHEVIRSPQQPL